MSGIAKSAEIFASWNTTGWIAREITHATAHLAGLDARIGLRIRVEIGCGAAARGEGGSLTGAGGWGDGRVAISFGGAGLGLEGRRRVRHHQPQMLR